MERYCFDTFAWVEYFDESPLGRRLERKVLETDALVLTPAVVITELEARALRAHVEFHEDIGYIRDRGSIIPISERIARTAAQYKASHGTSTVDSLIYATALDTFSVLLTEDKMLLKLKGVRSLRQL
jgi:predicted nucleic acid-binding protein